jgi:hypothetical protein
MLCVPPPERVLWRSETCCVWVGHDDAGAPVFNGLDREYLDGYEHAIKVAPDQFDGLRRARGERIWLADHGIGSRLNSY